MENFINLLASTIKIDFDYLKKLKDSIKTIKYLESLDYSTMPEPIKEMNQKLLTKRFKAQLQEISTFSMQKQHAALNSFFDSWKGQYEQVDDVLVIGLSIA